MEFVLTHKSSTKYVTSICLGLLMLLYLVFGLYLPPPSSPHPRYDPQ